MPSSTTLVAANCDQHKQQEKVWAALPDWARERPDHIRDALTEKHVAGDSSLAQFVGLKPYEEAGGVVLRDLSDDGNSGWLTDAALVNKLAAEKLDQIAATVRGEKWKWVEIILTCHGKRPRVSAGPQQNGRRRPPGSSMRSTR